MARACRRTRDRRAAQREEARRRAALQLMLGWPGPIAPIAGVLGSGVLYALERDGLAQCLGRDRVGCMRFALTDRGRVQARQEPARV